MKRVFAVLLALVLLALPVVSSEAAETGELLIASEKVKGSVGDIVKVNFELYPNLPDGRKLDSLSGSMKFDPEFLTLGSVNLVDEDGNKTSLMIGKAGTFERNIEPGILRLAFIDAFGVDGSGFWFQAEFRILKEGATEFIFNGITYTGVDEHFKSVTYTIDPIAVGGVYTEGESVPTGGAADETFAPLTPSVATPAGTTTKPTGKTTSTPKPTAAPTSEEETQEPETSAPETTEATEEPETPEPTEEPATEAPTEEPEPSSAVTEIDPDEPLTTAEPEPVPTKQPENTVVSEEKPNTLIVAGVIVGIVAVIGLGVLAIILILKRRKLDNE